MKYKIKLQRTHTCDDDVTKKTKTVDVKNDDIYNAIKEALEMAYSAQYYVFDDTGMDDGEYLVEVLDVIDENGKKFVPVPDAKVGYNMVYIKE